MTDRDRLKTTFGQDAARYHRARPTYPPELFDRLSGRRILEIAPGTGQATLPLTGIGDVTAVELSQELAAVAREHAPKAHIEVANFDEWPLPAEPFDLVVCATAFHWLDPATRMTKCARALKPGGELAVISTHHVAGGTEQFFVDVQECYERWDPATPPGLRLEPADSIPQEAEEIDRSGLFEPARFRRHATDIPYTTATYVDVLLTYSGHRALDPTAQRGLLECIAGLIDHRYGGQIAKRYLSQLRVARRLRDG